MNKKNKKLLCLAIAAFLIGITILFSLIKTQQEKKYINPWVGKYEFYEAYEVNKNLSLFSVVVVGIYEENNGLYAQIKVVGDQMDVHVKAKVWLHEDEALFELCDYYRDKDLYRLDKGDILLKLKRQKKILITEWGKIQPLLNTNKDPGEYLYKVIE